MGLVCESPDAARDNRNLADQWVSCLNGGHNFEANSELISRLKDNDILGILTLENVIEKILQMDIKDEKDIELRKNPLKKSFSTRTQSGRF